MDPKRSDTIIGHEAFDDRSHGRSPPPWYPITAGGYRRSKQEGLSDRCSPC